jgi:hypothetical protein
MSRNFLPLLLAAVIGGAGLLAAQGRTTNYGRATTQYESDDVKAVAHWDYSQTNHDGPWLLITFAMQTKGRLVLRRDQFALVTPDGRRLPLASHDQFVQNQKSLLEARQNARGVRQGIDGYFSSPITSSIRFFPNVPSGPKQDTFAVHLDDVAAGDLLFLAPEGKWVAGTYGLSLSHDRARVDIPILLK